VVEIGCDASFSLFLLTQEASTSKIIVPRPAHRYLFHPHQGDRSQWLCWGSFSTAKKVYMGSRWISSDDSPLGNIGGSTPVKY